MKAYKESLADHLYRNEHEEIAFYYSFNTEQDWHVIHLDIDDSKPEHECKYELYICKTGLFVLNIRNKPTTIDKMINHSDFDMLLLKLYRSHETEIIIDPDHVDTELSYYEEY